MVERGVEGHAVDPRTSLRAVVFLVAGERAPELHEDVLVEVILRLGAFRVNASDLAQARPVVAHQLEERVFAAVGTAVVPVGHGAGEGIVECERRSLCSSRQRRRSYSRRVALERFTLFLHFD